ncbi:MAG: hypothetical protein R3B72_03550 [Polyangiaceae bacterium]
MRRVSVALVLLLAVPSEAAAQCTDDGPLLVGLSAGAGAAAGALTALGSGAIVTRADPHTELSLLTAFGVGAAVTGGLSVLYGAVDGFTGCGLVNEHGGFAWSIPVTMAVVGTLLPIALWGAADREQPGTSSAALRGPSGAPLRPPHPGFGLTVRF